MPVLAKFPKMTFSPNDRQRHFQVQSMQRLRSHPDRSLPNSTIWSTSTSRPASIYATTATRSFPNSAWKAWGARTGRVFTRLHPEIYWIHIHSQGFDLPYSNGAFVWIEAGSKADYADTPADLRHLGRFYNIAKSQQPSMITVGGAWSGFDDSKAPVVRRFAALSAAIMRTDVA